MALLDRTFGAASPNVKVSNQGSAGKSIANGMISVNPLRDVSAYSACTSTQLGNIENAVTDMVPDAVQSILGTFSTSFGGNSSSISPDIGFKLYADNSSTLAYVAMQYGYSSAGNIGGIALNLSVNVASLQFDASGNLTSNSSEALKATIAHEMMHAFMDDVLTNGMLGATNGVKDSGNK